MPAANMFVRVISFLVNLVIGVIRGTWRLLVRQRVVADAEARTLLDVFALTFAADMILLIFVVMTVPGAVVALIVGVFLTPLPIVLQRKRYGASALLFLRAALTVVALFTGNHWLLLVLTALTVPQEIAHLVPLAARRAVRWEYLGRALVYGLVAGALLTIVGLLTVPLVVTAFLLMSAAALAFRLRPPASAKPAVVKPPTVRQRQEADAPEGYHVYRPSSLEDK